MRTLIALVVAAILSVPTLAPAFKQIRDGSGNLVETWNKVGDRIEVRDSHNNLSRSINRVGDRYEIRDGSNDKIGEVSGDRDRD